MRDIESHREGRLASAVDKGVQGELPQPVVLELQLLEDVQVGKGKLVHPVDGVVGQDDGGQLGQAVEGVALQTC